MGDCLGFELHNTFRLMSPQVAMESNCEALKAWMVGLILDLINPCNCIVCRDVILITPVEFLPAISCVAIHCCGVRKPPGNRSRIMNEYNRSSFFSARSSR